jgi:nucleotide-binding universal stress UspA family protein
MRCAVIDFNRILCPIDFSETSLKALAHAAALSRWYEAELDLLHVGSTNQNDDLVMSGSSAGYVRAVDAVGRQVLVAEMRRAMDAVGGRGVRTSLSISNGPVAEAIVDRAIAREADLMVISTHQRIGLSRVLAGSVTEHVMDAAPCPILVVPGGRPAAVAAKVVFKTILCAVDYSAASLEALRYALELSRQADGRVTVLHVLEFTDPDEPTDADLRTVWHQLTDAARDRLRALVAHESRTWCEVDEVVAPAAQRASSEILRRTSESGFDLVVMGRPGTRRPSLRGSNARRVVRASQCPVLVVPS